MAREHHCPTCGPQPCNASTSKIHTCGVCAAIWEEDLSVPAPAPAAPKPSAPAAPVAPAAQKPAAPAAPPTTPAKPGVPATPTASPTTNPAPKPAAAPAPSPAPQAATSKPPTAPPPGGKSLAQVVAAAKVKRCPKCTSDGLAQPSDFRMAQGRVILVDSQTYRGHEWYADTGDLLPNAPGPTGVASPLGPKPAPAT